MGGRFEIAPTIALEGAHPSVPTPPVGLEDHTPRNGHSVEAPPVIGTPWWMHLAHDGRDPSFFEDPVEQPFQLALGHDEPAAPLGDEDSKLLDPRGARAAPCRRHRLETRDRRLPFEQGVVDHALQFEEAGIAANVEHRLLHRNHPEAVQPTGGDAPGTANPGQLRGSRTGWLNHQLWQPGSAAGKFVETEGRTTRHHRTGNAQLGRLQPPAPSWRTCGERIHAPGQPRPVAGVDPSAGQRCSGAERLDLLPREHAVLAVGQPQDPLIDISPRHRSIITTGYDTQNGGVPGWVRV